MARVSYSVNQNSRCQLSTTLELVGQSYRPMQMVVLPSSGGFTAVAPMLFYSQITLSLPVAHVTEIFLGKLLNVFFPLFVFFASAIQDLR
jgi:hypothetical protein